MNKRTIAIARAVAVIGGTTALVAGATFAASNVGTVTLANNSFSAIQGLEIANSSGNFGYRVAGFAFDNVAVGDPVGSTKHVFYLKDTTNDQKQLGVTVTLGHWTSFHGLNTSLVDMNFQKYEGNAPQGAVQTASLAQLNTAGGLQFGPANMPDAGQGKNTKYMVWMTMKQGAITNLSAVNTGSGNNVFDLNFTGTAQ